ncbi:MAG: TerC family protein [Planctomycetes bacterium]|nr:TerC family protein [Planctomycetota bacterium]
MDATILFPFAEVWWLYGAFIGLVLAVLALDLLVFHRNAHVVSMKEAGAWTAAWVALAGVVNLAFWAWARHDLARRGLDPALGDTAALEFLAGYVIEKALAIDNIFVIAMTLGALSIPAQYRHRVLFYGIIGALVFRALFIGLGSALLQYHWVTLVAGAFLILTGIKMLLIRHDSASVEHNRVLGLLRRWMPISPTLDGQRFFTRRNGVRMATPLFVALLLVETTDIIFAIDSVPAIFALTDEPLIVFLSNILAILGLRSLYFLLEGSLERFHLLKYSLALILVFVGLKMAWLNDLMGGKFPIGWSLAIIAALLAPGFIASLFSPPRAKNDSVT